MRNRIVSICLIGGLLLAGSLPSPVQAQEIKGKTLEIKPRTGELAGAEFYTNSHALIIGINRYANLPKDKSFDFAEKDATDLRDVLVSSYGFLPENVTVLQGEDATKHKIEDALAGLADADRVKPNDRVVVFFSGHGQTVQLQNGGKAGFLVPQDAKVDLARPDNAGPYRATCLPMSQVWEALEACPARHRLLIVDACFGGLLAKGKSLNSTRPTAALMKTLLARPALQVLTAGGENEEAAEDPKLGNSIFTYHLLAELRAQAANADTVFTAADLATKLKTAVGNRTVGTRFPQTPQFASRDTEGEVFFVTTPKAKVPKLEIAPRIPNTNAVATKINRQDNADLVFIPAGEFTMGSTEADINALLASDARLKREWLIDEIGQHRVYLDGYYIYKTPVTVKQYKQFCVATGKQMPLEPIENFNPTWSREDYPIVNVSWEDATAYCRWLSQQTGRTITLPTEAQWEKAARGEDGRKFPWGNQWDGNRLQHSRTRSGDAGGTVSVGSFPNGASSYGVLDMAGNVWQWCADWYSANYYQSSPKSNPTGPISGKERVLRGGSWYFNREGDFRCTNRHKDSPTSRFSGIGFRCVVSAE